MSIKLNCTDCGVKLTSENKTARYYRCMACERIRYASVGLRKKKKLVEEFIKQPHIRQIEGYHGKYMVSNTGDIYSATEFGIKKLRPGINKAGYYLICLFENHKSKVKSVHRLVAQAFIENKYPYTKKVINHINGIKTDNRVENLEWTDTKGNSRHALRTGLQPKGEQIKTAKLDNEKVLFIHRNKRIKGQPRKDRLSQKELAEMFGVSTRLIKLVQDRKVWRHVPRTAGKPSRKLLLQRKPKDVILEDNQKGEE